jgi:hypothetical protein
MTRWGQGFIIEFGEVIFEFLMNKGIFDHEGYQRGIW